MERYYLIKSISVAPETNPNYSGSVVTHIIGKQDTIIYYNATGSYKGWDNIDNMFPYFVREYGYKRLCDARRNYIYKNPQNDEYWKTSVEIITVEIVKCADGEKVV